MEIPSKRIKSAVCRFYLGISVFTLLFVGLVAYVLIYSSSVALNKGECRQRVEYLSSVLDCRFHHYRSVLSVFAVNAAEAVDMTGGGAAAGGGDKTKQLMSKLMASVAKGSWQYNGIWVYIFAGNDLQLGSPVVEGGTASAEAAVSRHKSYSYYAGANQSGSVGLVPISSDFPYEIFYMKAVSTKKSAITPPYKDVFSRIEIFSIIHPVVSGGKVIGVAGIDISYDNLRQIFDNHQLRNLGSSLIHTDYRTGVQADYVVNGNGGMPEQEVRNALAILKTRPKTTVSHVDKLSNANYYTVFSKLHIDDISEGQWVLLVSFPENEIYKLRYEFGSWGWYVLAVALLIAVLALGYLALRLLRSVSIYDHWYHQVLDMVHSPIIISDVDMNVVYLNKTAVDFMGKERAEGIDELIGKPCAECMQTDICGTPLCPWNYEQCTADGIETSDSVFEYNGRKYKAEANFLHDINKQVNGRFEIFTDITMQEEMAAIIEACSTAVMVFGKVSNKVKAINKEGLRLLGCFSQREVLGQRYEDLCHFEHDKDSILGHGGVQYYDMGELVSYGSESRYVLKKTTELRFSDELCIVDSFIDITEQKAATEKYSQSEKHYSLAMRVANAMSWEFYPNEDKFVLSEHLEDLTGYSPNDICTFEKVLEIIHPDDRKLVTEKIDQLYTALNEGTYDGEVVTAEYRIVCSDEKVIWVRSAGAGSLTEGCEICISGFSLDISERKVMESELESHLAELVEVNCVLEQQQKRLVQQEKLASVGQLAAGVAHEINNPVGFVSSNLSTLKEYMEVFKDVYHMLKDYVVAGNTDENYRNVVKDFMHLDEKEDIPFVIDDSFVLISESQDGMNRVVNIVKNLKSFARNDSGNEELCDIHDVIENTLNILHNQLKYTCKVVREYGAIPEVVCSASQMGQVIMNIVVNASHAIKKEGVITIKTWQEGEQWICVSISDTGTGIPEDIMNKIFDPFFTTKEVGVGTGLGLSISHGIVEKHGGELLVHSQQDVGTTFIIKLPFKDKPVTDSVREE